MITTQTKKRIIIELEEGEVFHKLETKPRFYGGPTTFITIQVTPESEMPKNTIKSLK
jgi:hypothetical protein